MIIINNLIEAESRELRKSERAAAKQAKLSQQVINLELRILKLNNQKQIIDAKRRKARMELSDSFQPFSLAQDVDTLLRMDGYLSVVDPAILLAAHDAIHAASMRKVIDGVAGAMSCDRADVCLLEERIVNRKGVKVAVVYFRCDFNSDFNEMLKSTGAATFDRSKKAWNVVLDADVSAHLCGGMGDFFCAVVDLKNMVLLRRSERSGNVAVKRIAFQKSPFYFDVKIEEILAAILAARPSESILEESIFINDGSEFSKIPEKTESIITQMPFLLLRYGVRGGRPRYVAYSTVAKAIENISFGNDDKLTKIALARYMGTCQALGAKAFIHGREPSIEATPDLMKSFHGDFDRFGASIRRWSEITSGLDLAPLCSDYITLMGKGYGADSDAEGIIAYVAHGEIYGIFLRKVSAFFGYSTDNYPIIFTRSVIDDWVKDENGSNEFMVTVTHELAHILVKELQLEQDGEESHGVAWAVFADLLGWVFTNDYGFTEYYRYHPQEIVIMRRIEESVMEIGIPAIDVLMADCGKISKAEICAIALECLQAIARGEVQWDGSSDERSSSAAD